MPDLLEWLLILVIFAEAIIIYWLLNRNLVMETNCEHLKDNVEAVKREVFNAEASFIADTIKLEEEYNKNLKEVESEARKQKGRAQSAHTSKGFILEKWCPFIDHPEIEEHWKSENWTFMGNPLDYIVWDWYKNKEENDKNGKIILLDVKSGNSKLTTKQRRIRDLILAGNIEWREIRLK